MTAAMTAAPKGLDYAGRQARGHAHADQHEEHRNLEFPERLHGTSFQWISGKWIAIVFWDRANPRSFPELIVMWVA
jgi:hypothetical protein